MKPTVLLPLLAFLIAFSQAQFFTLLTARSASPIHLSPLNANGGGLWVGKPQSDYCPVIQGLTCANTTGLSTAYGVGGGNDDENGGGLGLAVGVPGGQQIYIDPECGRIGYTLPHSASMPSGAITEGWRNTQLAWFGELAWSLEGIGKGILFCSIGNDSSVGPWQAYAALDNVTYGNACLGASLISSNVSRASGWEYTG